MKIYFLGICGTAMGNVARLMHAQGHEVAGCDAGIYPPMSDFLAEAAIPVREGYDPEPMVSWGPDLVVVGNALARGNPAVEFLLETRRFRFVSLPELIREQVLAERHAVVVAGTHGKTTTTAITAFLLREVGANPGWMLGGVPRDLEAGCAAGDADASFVIEGDEYDSAFFDKRSKFIHYFPRTLVLNNLEFDHSDIFRDLEDVQRSFSHLLRLVPGDGRVLINGDDPNLLALLPAPWTQVLRVGLGPENDLGIEQFSEYEAGSHFVLRWRGGSQAEIRWGLPGLFNARNAAMASLAAASALGLEDPTRLPLERLAGFTGVRRRQEVRRASGGLILVEDFGHHPTAVRETLRSFRARYPGAHLAAAFEPRSNTSTTRIMQAAWEEAFAEADSLWLAPVYRNERIPPNQRLDREALVQNMRRAGGEGSYFDDFSSMEAALRTRLVEVGDHARVLLLFSNGGFGGLAGRLAER